MFTRPVRTFLNPRSLALVGVPREFQEKEIRDFDDFGDKALKNVKDFIHAYLNNLPDNIEKRQGLFLYGSNGVGKTFLASLIVKEAYRRRFTTKRVSFVSYLAEYTRVWGIKDPDDRELAEDNLYTGFKSVELLVIEEIGKEIDTKISAPVLEDLLRYREERGLVTVICTNLAPNVVEEKYGASILSLIKGSMTPIKIVGKDKREQTLKERVKEHED